MLGVLAALAAIGAGAGAVVAASTPQDEAHLLLVPTDGASDKALARVEPRVVARYDAFTLVEAEGSDATQLERAGAERRDDMREVRLGARSLDPETERAALGRTPSAAAPALVVVQFVGPIKDGWLDRVRQTRARLVIYMAQNSYLVHAASEAELDALSRLDGAPGVRAVVPFNAGDKLTGVNAGGPQRLAIQTLSGADGAPGRGKVDDAGRPLRPSTALGPFRTDFVVADAARARQIAEDPGVVSVQAEAEPEPTDEVQGQLFAGAVTGPDPLVPSGPGYFAFHEGLGLGSATFPFTVDLTDTGLDAGVVATSHPDFHEEGALTNPSRLTYNDNFTTDADATDCEGHGTVNAGILGGFNTATGSTGATAVEDADGFNYGLGIAPRARLGGSKIFRCSGEFDVTSSFQAVTTNAYTKGARISTNSWGARVRGAYTPDAQTYDRLVRDADPGTPGNQEMVELFSAGNAGPAAGTMGAPGTAKNVLTVGAAENVRSGGTDGCGATDANADDAHDMAFFSSRGPTTDGRRKPDVVGPGTHVTGPRPQHGAFTATGVCDGSFPAGSTLYAWSSGTSQSTPAVAGMGALVREWYRQKKGSGTAVPSPALNKAIIANSATDLVGGDDGAGGANTNVPNQTQGWGLPSLTRALDNGPRVFRDQEDVLRASGEQRNYVVDVQDTTKPVRVTLAYTDTFGPTTGAAFVNDLNLTVAAGAGTFKGNVFDGGQSVTGGSADPRNNLESVYLPVGTVGSLLVQVTAAGIGGDGVPGNADTTDQDFALVVSNATETGGPVLAPDDPIVTPGGDADGALEPGEPFTVSETLTNTGMGTATAITGTMTAPAGVTITDGTTAWPDLAPTQSAANGNPLAGVVGAGATCGETIAASIAVTSAEGATATIPVPLRTGGLGAPAMHTSTDVPKAIPDGNAAGVTSTLSIATPGIIKDVNVRIASLTHPFVGDLRLQITAPDGTTVLLANNVGGGGDNFTNTVFDDEAALIIGTGGTSPPFTGSFKPNGDQLSRLDDGPQQGTWTLTVSDDWSDHTGTLNGWGLDVSPAECSTPAPVPPPRSLPGVVRQSVNWLLRDELTAGPATTTFGPLGTKPLVPFTGDWDGNGSKTPGIFSAGALRLYDSMSPMTSPLPITFGDSRGFPVAGDFDGDGRDDVAIYRNGLWQIRLATGATSTVTFGSGS